MLAEGGSQPGHVFNLGHGVLPETDPDVLARLVELVHAETALGRPAAAGDGPPVRTGVLVMAYGTPTGPDEVEAFYTDVRRGRPPSAEQLADLAAPLRRDRRRLPARRADGRAGGRHRQRRSRSSLRAASAPSTAPSTPKPQIEDAVDELGP